MKMIEQMSIAELNMHINNNLIRIGSLLNEFSMLNQKNVELVRCINEKLLENRKVA